MKCANPTCPNSMLYLRGGTLRLLEFDGPLEARLLGEPAGFPVFLPRARYFWLCPDCSREIILKRWTPDGLVLEARASSGNGQVSRWTVPARPAVEPGSVLHFRKRVEKTA